MQKTPFYTRNWHLLKSISRYRNNCYEIAVRKVDIWATTCLHSTVYMLCTQPYIIKNVTDSKRCSKWSLIVWYFRRTTSLLWITGRDFKHFSDIYPCLIKYLWFVGIFSTRMVNVKQHIFGLDCLSMTSSWMIHGFRNKRYAFMHKVLCLANIFLAKT